MCHVSTVEAGLLQPRRLRALSWPIRHPHEYSQLELRTAVYVNLRDFLKKTHQISDYYMLKIIWV